MSSYIYQLLKGVGLSERYALELLPRVQMSVLDMGRVIWPKGGQVDAWTYIVSGLVSAGVPLQEGGSIQVSIYGPRTWFGEEPLLNRYPSSLDYVCLTPVRVVSLSTPDAMAAFRHESEFARFVALLMAWRSRQHSERIVLVKQGSPALRVVMGLALFAEAMYYSSSRPPTQGLEGTSVKIPVKQSVVASVCGVSRSAFSELVQPLASAGFLHANYATLELCSIETWLRFSRKYQKNRMNLTKPTIEELMLLLQQESML